MSGTVRFNGQPLPSGTVLLHGADGRVEHALIGRDGGYAVANAPLGAVRVTVQAHAAAPVGLPTKGKPPALATAHLPPGDNEKRDGKFVSIPSRYADADKSGLTCSVRAGTQTHDIALQP